MNRRLCPRTRTQTLPMRCAASGNERPSVVTVLPGMKQVLFIEVSRPPHVEAMVSDTIANSQERSYRSGLVQTNMGRT